MRILPERTNGVVAFPYSESSWMSEAGGRNRGLREAWRQDVGALVGGAINVADSTMGIQSKREVKFNQTKLGYRP